MPSELKEKLFYGWVIVFVILFITLIITGPRFTFGVFFKPIANEFNLSRAATSSLFSVYMLFCAFFTLAGGWALDRYGPRLVFSLMGFFTGLSLILTSQTSFFWQLYLSYSLLLSVGTAPFFPVAAAAVSRWFDKKRGLAVGIAHSGSRLGQVFFAPFYTFLISHYGWHMAYMVTGLGTWFLVIPISRLLRNNPGEVGAQPDGARLTTATQKENDKDKGSQLSGFSLSQAFRTKNYWFLLPVWLFLGFSNLLVFTHLVPYATDVNVTAMEAATVISVLSVFAFLSAILSGKISDVLGRKAPLIFLILLGAGALTGIIWARELWMFYLFAVAYGISAGGVGIIFAVLNVDIFGTRSIGLIMGTLDVAFAIGAAIGSFTGGLMYDLNNSYTVPFLIAATLNTIIALLVSFLKVESKQRHV